MELEEGDVVLCTVDRIVGTIVFVKIHGNKGDLEGSIITSEIAPGRIRNLRDYVVPGKKIVCKVLRIKDKGHIDLSLRRVSGKEKKQVMDEYKLEKSSESILKSVLKEKAKDVIEKIKKKEKLQEFLQKAKTIEIERIKLEKITGKENAKKILEILQKQKTKEAVIRKDIFLKTTKPNGLSIIKEILNLGDNKNKKTEIKYISAGKYSLKVKSKDFKEANNKMQNILLQIEQKAKKHNADFSVKEGKK